jgi:hypothetical protein
LPTLAPGTGKTQKAWLWAYARDDTPFAGTRPHSGLGNLTRGRLEPISRNPHYKIRIQPQALAGGIMIPSHY